MRYLLIGLALILCCAALAPAASAAPRALSDPQALSSDKPHPTAPAPQRPLPELQPLPSGKHQEPNTGSYDPYVRMGDLHTKAVPVCCCSFGFCEETPNAPCTGGPGACRCNETGNLCVHI